MELHRICLGPRSTARWRIRWIAAALEAEYDGEEFGPVEPIPIPATDAVQITRDGSSIDARFASSGENLCFEGRLVDSVGDHRDNLTKSVQNVVQDSLLNGEKDTLNVQIQDPVPTLLGMLIEWSSPGCAGVGEQNINMICRLRYFL